MYSITNGKKQKRGPAPPALNWCVQVVIDLMTRMAAALARIRPRRVLRAARKREGSGKCITGCDERKVGLIENTACDDVTVCIVT